MLSGDAKIIGLLRLFTLGSRSGMVFLFAALLSGEQFGEFTLITTIVGYGLLVAGLDLYVFTNREISTRERDKAFGLLIGHFSVIAVPYIFLVPAGFWLAAYFGFHTAAIKILLIMVVEHFNQEGYRFLVSLDLARRASIVLAIRSASWVWVALPLMVNAPMIDRLQLALSCWLVASLIAFVYLLFCLRSEIQFRRRFEVPWRDFRASFSRVLSFWFSTISFRLSSVGDRFVVAAVGGVALSGKYGLGMSMAMLGAALYEPIRLDSRFAAFRRDLSTSEAAKARGKLLDEVAFSWKVGFGFFCFLLVIFYSFKFFLPSGSNFDFPGWLIFPASFYGGLSIPHIVGNYCLYVTQNDRALLQANYLAVVVFGIVLLFAAMAESAEAIVYAPLASMALMTFMKQSAARQYLKV